MNIHWVQNPEGKLKNDWNDFVRNNAKSNFFQSSEFVSLYHQNGYNVQTIVGYFDDQVVASYNILLLEENLGPFRFLTKRAVCWGLPLFTSEEYLMPLLRKVLALYQKAFIYWEIRPLDILLEAEIKSLTELGFIVHQHYTIFHKIDQSQFENYHSGRKKNIRRALRNEHFHFRELTEKHEYLEAGKMIVQLYKSLKLPCPNDEFFLSTYDFSSVRCFAIYHEAEIVACRFVLLQNTSIYDWYAANNSVGKNKYANDLIVHNIFQWGKENGFKHFDFGGAGNRKTPYGVRDYKLKFGGELIEIGRPVYIRSNFLYKIGKFGFWITKRLRKL